MSYNYFTRIIKLSLVGLSVFCVCWIISVNEWHGGVRWEDVVGRDGVHEKLATMRTIVAYSEEKLAELERPSPVVCDRVPAFPNITKVDRSWSAGSPTPQWQRVPSRAVSLYAAYYDTRAHRPYVRILALFNGRNFSTEEPLYCQTRGLSTYRNIVEVVAATALEIWWRKWDQTSLGVETPLLLSCPLTAPLLYSSVVSVVRQPCEDPVTAFQIDTNTKRQKQRNFTVCVKDMNFDSDVSRNLIEWIEINKILGADVIDVYIDQIRNETAKVLEHYNSQGFLRLFHAPINSYPNRSLWQRRRDHVITYNDCLYRNIQESDFIIPLDIDEILLPKVTHTWQELIKRLAIKHDWNSTLNSAIVVQNVFFFNYIQNNSNYENDIVRSDSRNKFTKRDAVRFGKSKGIELNDLDLLSNQHSLEINDTLNRELRRKYIHRCGCDLQDPKIVRNLMRSTIVSPVGHYSKSLMVTQKVLTAFNHYPLNILGVADHGWPAPFNEVQLSHYKVRCNAAVMSERECARYESRARADLSALRLRRPLERALLQTVCTCT